MRWCGPEVEVEGIVSLKTGGCPEDCHFCSQSGQFTSPVRSVWLDIPELVKAAEQTRATGASEFCIVAAVRGPDERLMRQMREGVKAIKEAVDIEVAASLGMVREKDPRIEWIVVSRAGLGTLNHTNLTVWRIQDSGFYVQGIVIGSWPNDPGLAELHNRNDLSRHSGVPVLGAIPEGAALLDPAAFRAQAQDWIPYLSID